MSVPLPHSIISTTSNTSAVFRKGTRNCQASDLFLDPDERYEVYVVKAAERPHLLPQQSNYAAVDKDQNDNDSHPPPLLDGCDIPAWRNEGLMLVGHDDFEVQGVLNIGAACTLFRRERQWPRIVHSMSPWETLLQKMKIPPPNNATPRVSCQQVMEQIEWKKGYFTTRFAWEWEQHNQPVIIEHATDGWSAMPKYDSSNQQSLSSSSCHSFWNGGGQGGWTFENLLTRFGHVSWRFSDTHGEMMPLATYAKYIVNPEGQTDDSPLAIYDAEFGNDEPTDCLLQEYKVPPCFSPDLFGFASDSVHRPPYQWILIGPARSGTGLHIDPLWTNAWVTVLQGCKRWMLFPPSTPPDQIGMGGDFQIPSVLWFRDYYDKVTSPDWPNEWKPVQVLQQPGQTVYVPNGWPHLVLNLELTVAITHNYASEFGPFERMWEEVAEEEPEFAKEWYQGLLQCRPDLAARINNVPNVGNRNNGSHTPSV